ncbi:related to TR4 orphan receptor associated protein TRA16 [Melanopsichium pennsylvanicum]|uniref:Related to TR4 orphan receptor associated protein TRA16 n=1 Tax=Melanopsichium pennsylvanicum TaxID=63383 RepID=A0AAJ4XM02_9BASI|nr:related to TR4 orphan receptor associated protein TRA16 [Melanopsichium pennsylvanicum]
MSAAPTLSAPAPPDDKELVNILTLGEVKVKVSSGTSKEAKNILTEDPESCWTSDNLAPNSDPCSSRYLISFKLAQTIRISALHSISLTFAGGFSPMSLNVLGSEQDGKTWFAIGDDEVLHPKDTNAKQYFDVHNLVQTDTRFAGWLRFQFNGSTDDYGRITVYGTQIFAILT